MTVPANRGRHARAQTTSRRTFLRAAAGAAVAVGGVAAGLAISDEVGEPAGGLVEGTFYSRYRRREVGYWVGWPQGYSRGDRLPLVLSFHGFKGTHASAFAGFTPAQAMALAGPGVRPMALASIDGGGGYWHPHPGDDPMGMVLHEFLPMLQRWDLGVRPHEIGAMGISMGGYGAILFAEKFPRRFRAVAAISPAIFVTYEWVHYVNPGAYWSAEDFATYDAVTHTGALRATPVRIASGLHDPFHPWVEELAARLPARDVVVFPPGAHTGAFFRAQIGPSLRFLGQHLR